MDSSDLLIEYVLSGTPPKVVLDNAINGSIAPVRHHETSIPRYSIGGRVLTNIKAYFDSYGDLRFCTPENVLIDPSIDERLQELINFSESASADHDVLSILNGFEGSLDELYRRVKLNWSLGEDPFNAHGGT